MEAAPAFTIRRAMLDDVPTILRFVQELAAYEKLSHQMTATVEQMREQLFGPTPHAEVRMACENGVQVGFALFFHNFSTFLAKPGLSLEGQERDQFFFTSGSMEEKTDR